MKKNDKTKEKKQRVRVLETGELGTVTDQQLIPRRGGLHRYVQVRMDKRPHLDRWYWDDQLGGTREHACATFACGGQQLDVRVARNYETDLLEISLTGSPENLKEHRGLHMMLMTAMMASLVGSKENIVRADLRTED